MTKNLIKIEQFFFSKITLRLIIRVNISPTRAGIFSDRSVTLSSDPPFTRLRQAKAKIICQLSTRSQVGQRRQSQTFCDQQQTRRLSSSMTNQYDQIVQKSTKIYKINKIRRDSRHHNLKINRIRAPLILPIDRYIFRQLDQKHPTFSE